MIRPNLTITDERPASLTAGRITGNRMSSQVLSCMVPTYRRKASLRTNGKASNTLLTPAFPSEHTGVSDSDCMEINWLQTMVCTRIPNISKMLYSKSPM